MEILQTRILRGPNYWSNHRKKLIVMTIDLGAFETQPTHCIPLFNEKLKELMPSLFNHFCSEGREGGFFSRLEDGTWLGHVIEHVALELQWLAGMHCGFGRTRSTNEKGVYDVVFAYQNEHAGLYAGKIAFEIIKELANQKDYNQLPYVINHLKNIREKEQLGPSTQAIFDEADKRGIPHRFINNSLIMLGQGSHQKRIWSAVTDRTSFIGGDIAADKVLTKKILAEEYIPVPEGVLLHSVEDIDHAIAELGYPFVIKPCNANHGRGISTNITTKEKAISAFFRAIKISDTVIAERFIKGFDYRFLVINYKLVAVAKRTPAMIEGDGVSSVQVLIDTVNNHPHRGIGHQKNLTTILIDEMTLAILRENNLTLNDILPKGKILFLKNTANLSSGGTAADVTDSIHPQNKFLAERIARIINLDICGIDIIAEDVSKVITQDNGAVLEVNAGPGLRMHLCPNEGQKRNVAKPIIDMLFPNNTRGRIPLVAVTGTNGKTTVVRLIAHIAKHVGHSVGFTTTDGIYINDYEISKGDSSGPKSACRILGDRMVDYAVLETARGGILREGLGWDHCDISIVTNISADHLGISGIDCLEELSRVKSVVPRATFSNGFAILNADDELVLKMRGDLECQIALFSMQSNNQQVIQHCKQGGLAAFMENDFFVVQKGNSAMRIAKKNELPLTFFGQAECMIKNVLPAILAALVSNFKLESIIEALKSFMPSVESMPGRMNLFKINGYKVLIDYAHNEGAFIELKKYLAQVDATKKIGIIAGTGDRREIDIQKVGVYAAEMFDEIIIRHDRDGRGKSNQELTNLILQGIKRVKDDVHISVISNEFEAFEYAMKRAGKGDLIYYFPDQLRHAIDFVQKIQKNYSH